MLSKGLLCSYQPSQVHSILAFTYNASTKSSVAWMCAAESEPSHINCARMEVATHLWDLIFRALHRLSLVLCKIPRAYWDTLPWSCLHEPPHGSASLSLLRFPSSLERTGKLGDFFQEMYPISKGFPLHSKSHREGADVVFCSASPKAGLALLTAFPLTAHGERVALVTQEGSSHNICL